MVNILRIKKARSFSISDVSGKTGERNDPFFLCCCLDDRDVVYLTEKTIHNQRKFPAHAKCVWVSEITLILVG